MKRLILILGLAAALDGCGFMSHGPGTASCYLQIAGVALGFTPTSFYCLQVRIVVKNIEVSPPAANGVAYMRTEIEGETVTRIDSSMVFDEQVFIENAVRDRRNVTTSNIIANCSHRSEKMTLRTLEYQILGSDGLWHPDPNNESAAQRELIGKSFTVPLDADGKWACAYWN
jgi:hypothetical protein